MFLPGHDNNWEPGARIQYNISGFVYQGTAMTN